RPAPSRCQASGAATGRTARATRQQSSYTDHDGSHVTQWRNSSEPSSSLSIVQYAATASMAALRTVARDRLRLPLTTGHSQGRGACKEDEKEGWVPYGAFCMDSSAQEVREPLSHVSGAL